MITIAICIIALCEIARALQNMMQLKMYKHDTTNRDNAYAEFVKSLKTTDKEFVERLLMEFKNNGDTKND